MKKLMATTVAASLAFGAGCGRTPDRTPTPELQRAFETSTQFWQSKGVPLLGKNAVKLIEIKGENDTYTCKLGLDRIDEVSSYDMGDFCQRTNAVVIGKDGYEGDREDKRTNHGLAPNVYTALLIGHEVAHAVQRQRPEFGSKDVSGELGADCLSGIENDKIPAEQVEKFYEDLGDAVPIVNGDDPHGTTQQRIDAFQRGQQADGDMWMCVGLGLGAN